MRLIGAHITNFGKLHDTDIQFDEHLSTFLHENGWGKTTLSVFIKSMFYGMEHTTSRDVSKNEKKKYEPWQGGNYGGTLTFSHNGREYRVSRTFSTAANQDTFELIDLATNQPSKDFSSDLGTELFGVSKETYGRSAYVTLNEIPENSPDISAKLNNLVEEGDVSNYDDAVRILDKKATDIKAKRGNSGILAQIQEKIDEDHESLDDIKTLIAQNIELKKKIDAENAEVAKCTGKQEQVSAQIADNARYESKARYEQLEGDVERASGESQEIEAFFNGHVPEDEKLSGLDMLSRDYTTVASNIQTQSATQSQKDEYSALAAWFGGDVPSRGQIDECLKADQALKAFRQTAASMKLTGPEEDELARLSGKYAGGRVSKDVISGFTESISTIQKMKDERTALKEACAERMQQAENEKRENSSLQKRKRAVFFVAAALALVAGGVLFALKMTVPGIAAAACAALLAIPGFMLKGKKGQSAGQEAAAGEAAALTEKIAALEAKVSEKEAALKLFTGEFAPGAPSEFAALSAIGTEFDNYSRLDAKKKAYGAWLSGQVAPEGLEEKLRIFMKRYLKTDDITSVATDIQILNEKLTKLEKLQNLINSDCANSDTKASLASKLDAVLAEWQTDKTKSYALQVQQVHEKLTTLSNCKNALKAAEANLASFKAEHEADIAAFSTLEKPVKSTDELKASLAGYTNEISGRNKLISDYQKQLDMNLAKTDKKEDTESELEELMLLKSEKTKEREMLLKTLDLLKQAKDNLDRNYSASMIGGFNKYIGMLGSDLNLAIDKDLNVSVDAEGSFHKSDYLSEGYKDMVNFCARMALVDALFEDVTPPVILDDPFVNLDDRKVPAALKLVKELSKENQVIYFACHESRAVR